MKVLVVGSGGREHAICWRLAQSPLLTRLYCAPGNPGVAGLAELVPIGTSAVDELAGFARSHAVDLTVVGPEQPLTRGLADELESRGLKVFGPRQSAAVLEGSKVFAKEFMVRHGIPTADFQVVEDAAAARSAAADFGFPIVLKADGLAAGKGVIIAQDAEELDAALKVFFEERRFGKSGDRVLVEECLRGEEVSFIALADGERLLPLAGSKDYKRVGEDDRGPNTGGMGAHSPAVVLDDEMTEQVLARIMTPTIAGMASEDRRFVGVLYAGLMLTSDGPKVMEFNVRLGDPEAQALLPRLDEDLLPLLVAAAEGKFTQDEVAFRSDACACIVLASKGYPGKPVSGEVIRGLAAAAEHPEVVIFHAGTKAEGSNIVAVGGRVLNVCARGGNLREALQRAYAAADVIQWPSKILRRDIGARVLAG